LDLQLELGPSPLAELGVISDHVAASHPDPLRDQPVLLQFLDKLHLDAEGLENKP
jgi:hypothetical protein